MLDLIYDAIITRADTVQLFLAVQKLGTGGVRISRKGLYFSDKLPLDFFRLSFYKLLGLRF